MRFVFDVGAEQARELVDLADHAARAVINAIPHAGTLDEVRSFMLSNAMVHLEGDVHAVKELLRGVWQRYSERAGGLS